MASSWGVWVAAVVFSDSKPCSSGWDASACPGAKQCSTLAGDMRSSCISDVLDGRGYGRVKRELVQYCGKGHIALVQHHFDSRGRLKSIDVDIKSPEDGRALVKSIGSPTLFTFVPLEAAQSSYSYLHHGANPNCAAAVHLWLKWCRHASTLKDKVINSKAHMSYGAGRTCVDCGGTFPVVARPTSTERAKRD